MAILIFAAHPDDVIIGCGGLIAKYLSEGKEIIPVFLSYGEGIDPFKDPEVVVRARLKEAQKAFNALGCEGAIFLGLADLHFSAQLKEPDTKRKIEHILDKYRPKVIFTHAADDFMASRRNTGIAVRKLLKELNYKAEFYTFRATVPIRFMYRNLPRLYIDISKHFRAKLKALEAFESMRTNMTIYYRPMIRVYNFLAGLRAGFKYAEVFYKL